MVCTSVLEDCTLHPYGFDYSGSGSWPDCVNWPKSSGFQHHNYCRNPDFDTDGLYCFNALWVKIYCSHIKQCNRTLNVHPRSRNGLTCQDLTKNINYLNYTVTTADLPDIKVFTVGSHVNLYVLCSGDLANTCRSSPVSYVYISSSTLRIRAVGTSSPLVITLGCNDNNDNAIRYINLYVRIIDSNLIENNIQCNPYLGTFQDYNGQLEYPYDGGKCRNWGDRFKLKNGYCRNPSQSPMGPWCYVKSGEKRACNIDFCDRGVRGAQVIPCEEKTIDVRLTPGQETPVIITRVGTSRGIQFTNCQNYERVSLHAKSCWLLPPFILGGYREYNIGKNVYAWRLVVHTGNENTTDIVSPHLKYKYEIGIRCYDAAAKKHTIKFHLSVVKTMEIDQTIIPGVPPNTLQDRTDSNTKCIEWSKFGHKYCLNPFSERNGPWCYVNTNESMVGEWEYCSINRIRPIAAKKGGFDKLSLVECGKDNPDGLRLRIELLINQSLPVVVLRMVAAQFGFVVTDACTSEKYCQIGKFDLSIQNEKNVGFQSNYMRLSVARHDTNDDAFVKNKESGGTVKFYCTSLIDATRIYHGTFEIVPPSLKDPSVRLPSVSLPTETISTLKCYPTLLPNTPQTSAYPYMACRYWADHGMTSNGELENFCHSNSVEESPWCLTFPGDVHSKCYPNYCNHTGVAGSDYGIYDCKTQFLGRKTDIIVYLKQNDSLPRDILWIRGHNVTVVSKSSILKKYKFKIDNVTKDFDNEETYLISMRGITADKGGIVVDDKPLSCDYVQIVCGSKPISITFNVMKCRKGVCHSDDIPHPCVKSRRRKGRKKNTNKKIFIADDLETGIATIDDACEKMSMTDSCYSTYAILISFAITYSMSILYLIVISIF